MSTSYDSDEFGEAAARVGRTLRDKWHLDALIDVGGMSAVYAATHRNGMRGAVKILHPDLSGDPEVAARFRAEGYIANKVGHPNAVRVLDDDVDDGDVFLVMELLEGTTLRQRALARLGKLEPDEVLQAADQVLDVLAFAHERSIVHRDIKPDNIFVKADGQIMLLDFGIAQLAETTAQDGSAEMLGLLMGTPAFMSPEQARGRWDVVGPQSDLWSVGATMFTLLTGEQVHVAETVTELLSATFTRPARSLGTVLEGCPPGLTEVVDRALQLRLADRWPDAREMQAAVRAVHREMYGFELPVLVTAVHHPAPRGAVRAVAASTGGPTRIVRRAGWTDRPRGTRRPMLVASAATLATALMLAAAERGSGSLEPSPPGSALLAETGESPPASAALPAPPQAPRAATGADLALEAPRRRARPPASFLPPMRAHRPSIYDRRF